jgi:hypothetical protein
MSDLHHRRLPGATIRAGSIPERSRNPHLQSGC